MYIKALTVPKYCKSLSIDNILECITVELMTVNQKNVLVSCIYRKLASNTDTLCEEIECIFGNVQTNKTMFYVETLILIL